MAGTVDYSTINIVVVIIIIIIIYYYRLQHLFAYMLCALPHHKRLRLPSKDYG